MNKWKPQFSKSQLIQKRLERKCLTEGDILSVVALRKKFSRSVYKFVQPLGYSILETK